MRKMAEGVVPSFAGVGLARGLIGPTSNSEGSGYWFGIRILSSLPFPFVCENGNKRQ